MNIVKKLFSKKNNQTHVFEISMPKIQLAFEKMEKEAGWDTKDKLFWGYYFLDHNLQILEKFAEKLKKIGYQIVEIRNAGKDDLFLLHVEEHVVHSLESFVMHCHKLADLANDNNIEIFDGWDAEKVNLNKGLVQ